jgi:hypothetical protein
LGFWGGKEPIEYVYIIIKILIMYIIMYKKEFIGLAYLIGSWVVKQWLSALGRAREPRRGSGQEASGNL